MKNWIPKMNLSRNYRAKSNFLEIDSKNDQINDSKKMRLEIYIYSSHYFEPKQVL